MWKEKTLFFILMSQMEEINTYSVPTVGRQVVTIWIPQLHVMPEKALKI